MYITDRNVTSRRGSSCAGMTAVKDVMCQMNGANKELKVGESASA